MAELTGEHRNLPAVMDVMRDEVAEEAGEDAVREAELEDARRIAGEHEAAASQPTECPYPLDQIFEDDWYPEPPQEPT